MNLIMQYILSECCSEASDECLFYSRSRHAAVKLWRKKTEVRTELKKDRDPESKIKSCYHKCFCVHAVRAYPLSYAEPAQPHGEAMDQERPLITRLSPPRSDNTQQPLQSFQCRRPARKASSARPVVGDIYLTRRFRDVMGWSARLANPGTRLITMRSPRASSLFSGSSLYSKRNQPGPPPQPRRHAIGQHVEVLTRYLWTRGQ